MHRISSAEIADLKSYFHYIWRDYLNASEIAKYGLKKIAEGS